MALIVEDGTGIVDAASYISVATANTYWVERSHTTFATTWAAGSTENKEGAAREATDFLDANFGAAYKGDRKSYVQGLMWPRTGAMDESGYELPDLPSELVQAACELSARAISARLAADADLSGVVSKVSEKVGPVASSTEYKDGAGPDKQHGFVVSILQPILTTADKWKWALV